MRLCNNNDEYNDTKHHYYSFWMGLVTLKYIKLLRYLSLSGEK